MLPNIIFMLIGIQSVAHSSRILGIFHEPSFSHQILGRKLLFELATRGHNVTMLTPVLPKHEVPNFTAMQLDLKGQGTSAAGGNLFKFFDAKMWSTMVNMDEVGLLWTETVLKEKNLQRLLQSNQQFDIVIMEQLGNHALKGICYYYNAICVVLSTMGPTWLTNEQMRNPSNPSFMPDMLTNYPPKMTFFQRFYNAFVQLVQQVYFYTYTVNRHNDLLQKYFPGSPHMREILYNVSLVLLNSHYSTSNPAANLPNVVEIGGFHIDPPKQLPSAIELFLDEAQQGAIYFSMGSNLQVQHMDKVKLEAIVKRLGQLPQKVLWKLDSTVTPPGLPSNIMLVKWAPQLDVLAHPNVRLFITHCGLLSITEAVWFGVPVLGISVFADQGYNAAFADASGFGVAVPYNILTEENFGRAINALLNNSTYMDNAKKRSKMLHDQPMTPMEKATFWIEYVIRHKGAPHLRSAALSLSWIQYLLLDVFFSALLFIIIIACIVQKICSSFCCRSVKRLNDQKQKVQ
uniref:UDP-glucuronosyltransferase n=2 Tax=Photinus pyralis TaxID=7054 RepID=A0A1Y1KDC8_PHOPY